MSASDGFVLSSWWEGFPMVLLEFMACKLPAVATKAGDNSEIIENNKTGFLAPIQDSRSLSRSMEKLMDLSKSERRKMGKKGRKHIKKNFSIKSIIDNWENTYIKLLNDKNLR